MKAYFLADDLSGALDAAAAFHHAGRRVRIVLSAIDWSASEDEVVGVTTETRNASPLVAAGIVETTIAHGRAQGARLVYKKIDSTVRGPVAAEIGALARQMPGTRILLLTHRRELLELSWLLFYPCQFWWLVSSSIGSSSPYLYPRLL